MKNDLALLTTIHWTVKLRDILHHSANRK